MAIIRFALMALLLAVPSSAQAIDWDIIINNFIQDRRENIYSTVKAMRNATKDYKIEHGEFPESIDDLKNAGYLPDNFDSDRFFGSMKIEKKTVTEDGEDRQRRYLRVEADEDYKRIVNESTRGFKRCSEQGGCSMNDVAKGKRERTKRIITRNPKQDASISEATLNMMRKSLNKSLGNMVRQWEGQKAEVNKDFIKLTSSKPFQTYEYRAIDEENLNKNTYVGAMFVLSHKSPRPEGEKCNPDDEPPLPDYCETFSIPPIKRFNPTEGQKMTLMAFEGGDFLYLTPESSGGQGTGFTLEWNTTQNPLIQQGDESRIKIARMVVWTPSKDGGFEEFGGEEDDE